MIMEFDSSQLIYSLAHEQETIRYPLVKLL
jgi:hypothetical protein